MGNTIITSSQCLPSSAFCLLSRPPRLPKHYKCDLCSRKYPLADHYFYRYLPEHKRVEECLTNKARTKIDVYKTFNLHNKYKELNNIKSKKFITCTNCFLTSLHQKTVEYSIYDTYSSYCTF